MRGPQQRQEAEAPENPPLFLMIPFPAFFGGAGVGCVCVPEFSSMELPAVQCLFDLHNNASSILMKLSPTTTVWRHLSGHVFSMSPSSMFSYRSQG